MEIHTTAIAKAKYAGIDFHKKTSVVAIGDPNGRLLEHITLMNDSALVTKYFQQFVGLDCVIESF